MAEEGNEAGRKPGQPIDWKKVSKLVKGKEPLIEGWTPKKVKRARNNDGCAIDSSWTHGRTA